MQAHSDREENGEDDENNRPAMGVPCFDQVCDSSVVMPNSRSASTYNRHSRPSKGWHLTDPNPYRQVTPLDFRPLRRDKWW